MIAYAPFVDGRIEKGYTTRMRELLGSLGDVVPFDGVLRTWRRGRRRVDWLVLNWTDNELLDRRTRRIASRKVVRLFAKTLWFRLAARRLAFVRHNVYPHATAPGGEETATRWVDRYERLFDVVFVHSGDAAQRSRRYCPHPLYHRLPDVEPPRVSGLPERYFVAFGRIVPYKRLDRLVARFPADETLLVIGVVGDREHAARLAECCPPNVLFRPGPVSERDAQAIVGGSVALLIAHADPDVIVSSSFFFAMSLGTRVIAVATPFLRWIAPRLPVGAVTTTDDIAGLHRAVAACSKGRPLDVAAIEREFGDAAVGTALGAGMALPAAGATDAPDR